MEDNIFFYNGATQFENIGDLLINKSLVDLISSKGIVYIDDKALPESYLNQLISGLDNIKFISQQGLSYKSLLLSNLAKRFFAKGKIIYVVDTPGHAFDTSRTKISFVHRKSLYLRRLCAFFGVRFVRIGLSIGPFSKEYLKYFASYHKKNYLFGVRDMLSLEIARKANIPAVIYTPDLAWAYNVKKFHPALSNVKKDTKKIIISLRGAILGRGLEEEYYFKLKESVVDLAGKYPDHHFVFSYQVEFDKDICKELCDAVKDICSAEFISNRLTLNEALLLYASAGFIISNRLHVLLLGVLAGTVPVVLTDLDHHPKVTTIFKENSLGEFLTDMNDKERLYLRMKELISKYNEVDEQAKLSTIVENNKSNLYKIRDEFL